MAKRTKSSRRWLQEHESDVYVRRAREAGCRSRAVFKLEEVQRADRIIRPGAINLGPGWNRVDLGAAPGGWRQYAMHLLQGRGRVVALDILPMDEVAGRGGIHSRRLLGRSRARTLARNDSAGNGRNL